MSHCIHIVAAYPPNRGRLSEYTYELVKELSNKGYKIILFSDVKPDCKHVLKNVEVFDVWRPNDPLSLIRLLLKIIASRPKVVMWNVHFAVFGRSRLINFLGFLIIYLANLFRGLLGFKSIVVLHNIPDFLKLHHFIKPSFVNSLGLFLACKMAFTSDRIVVTLKTYRRYVEPRYGKDCIYIPHGTWFKPHPRKDGYRRRDSILFLGYLSPSKDMELLAEVFRKLRRQRNDVKLILATSPHPNFPEEIERLNIFRDMDGVEYLGYVEDKDLPDLFNRVVALVLPYSTPTGSSGIFHLASSFGVPVVSTDHLEFKELALDGAGIVTCKDSDEMVEALDRLMVDESYWRMLSAKNIRYSSERSWDRIADRYIEVIKELAH